MSRSRRRRKRPSPRRAASTAGASSSRPTKPSASSAERRWHYVLVKAAERDLRRLDPPVRARIMAALDGLAAGGGRGVNLRRLKGGGWRLRAGDWRARLERDEPLRRIVVLRILPRGRAYER